MNHSLNLGHWPEKELAKLEERKPEVAAALRKLGMDQEEIHLMIFGTMGSNEDTGSGAN